MSTPKPTAVADEPLADDPKRAALLEAALNVFARYGFRKTSMEEVARAAHISRQGLYLHFPNKDELFRATVGHTIQGSLAGAKRALALEAPVDERLIGAYDEWVGRYVGRFAADAADLMEAAQGLVMATILEHEKLFIDAVTAALREGGLGAAYKPAGITARQLAENLTATAKGLKHTCETREAFLEAMTVAVRITCAPLSAGR